MEIPIHPYNPTYPTSFAAIAAELSHDLLSPNNAPPIPYTTIHHVGSTAVPHLAGKPIIDILITIPASRFKKHVVLQQFKGALMHGERQGGYHFIGDGGVRGRWSFKLYPADPSGLGSGGEGEGGREVDKRVERNVYVVPEGGMVEKSHLALRDTLRADEGLRGEYEGVKVGLAAGGKVFGDVMEYATGKNGVVRRILRRAGWGEGEIDEKEAQAVRGWGGAGAGGGVVEI